MDIQLQIAWLVTGNLHLHEKSTVIELKLDDDRVVSACVLGGGGGEVEIPSWSKHVHVYLHVSPVAWMDVVTSIFTGLRERHFTVCDSYPPHSQCSRG